ncbi:MAG TPA: phosphatidylserine decarboxylase [Gammaproteobacteria bacterium]
MAKPLRQWLEEDVAAVRGKPMRWLSEHYFFRDPNRPVYADTNFFFPPADGIVLYAKCVAPDEAIVDIKGRNFSLREAMRLPDFNQSALVVGIFMTFYDVHINRMPYAGRLSYRELATLGSSNLPMLQVEKALLEELAPYTHNADYLFSNQRVLNTITSLELGQRYYVLQIADYDVDCITPFRLAQNQVFAQNQRFSQIRYGSQVDLIIPLSARYDFTPLVEVGTHVEGCVDPLVRITPRTAGVAI